MKLIDILPKSYSELDYKKFVQIMNSIPAEKPEDMDLLDWNTFFHLTVLSTLLDKPLAELERLPAIEIIKLIECLSFLDTPLKAAKSALKTKSINEISYDNFAEYQKLKSYINFNMWDNIDNIISIVIKGGKPEFVSVQEAYNVFFCLNKSLRKSIIYSQISLSWNIILMKLKQMFLKLKS